MLVMLALVTWIQVLNPTPAGPRMQIVAHEDDDLLFMNPSVQRAIDAGQPVVNVYLTAGDAGMSASYWQAREAGIRAAYAAMARMPNDWTPSRLRAGEAAFDVFVLGNPARVTALFLRLPDGGDGTGSLRYHAESLRLLWKEQIERLNTVDGRQSVTRASLIEDLTALLHIFGPTDVALSDCTAQHGWDHNDHFYSALFGLTAFNRYNLASTARLALHRGYNIEAEPENVDGADALAKYAAISAYLPHDSVLCPIGRPCHLNGLYERWVRREYRMLGSFALGGVGCEGGP